jgi:competence protein ComEA
MDFKEKLIKKLKNYISDILDKYKVATEYKRLLTLLGIVFVLGIIFGFAGGYFFGNFQFDKTNGDSPQYDEGILVENSSAGFAENDLAEKDMSEKADCDLTVEVAGAVKSPGVICLASETVLKDAIDEVGGFTEQACLKWVEREINQASLVEANTKIFIPSKADPECKSADENLSNTAPGQESDSDISVNSKISINSASSAQLESISGIGPATAEKIIQGRPYKSIEDVKEVKGIGESTFESIKDHIRL